MKLLRLKVISADTSGGLLNNLEVNFRNSSINEYSSFDPLCLIGPNGAGKSQFLQILTEIFQSVYNECLPDEERIDGNPDLQFEIEYLMQPKGRKSPSHVRISRLSQDRRRPKLVIQEIVGEDWKDCVLSSKSTHSLLPEKVIGYTSGENETLSLPFLISRSGYAEDVASAALNKSRKSNVSDTRLMLIDYGTNLEVVVSNLLTNDGKYLNALMEDVKLKDIHSFRCVIQLAHSAAPKLTSAKKTNSPRKGIQLTSELEGYLINLKKCSTSYTYDEKTEKYIFDFWVNDQTKSAFHYYWETTLDLYTSLHKLSMLNDLAIPRTTRERFKKDTKNRRFASRLPEPQDEDKVFRFEQVRFVSQANNNRVVDYVALSDGEHQLLQILGMFSMLSFSNVLFLLDEPESHLNPQWRVKFVSRLLELPTKGGIRREISRASEQDCLLTTHAPFVPSDMPRNKVLIFRKEKDQVVVKYPEIETYGTTFDTILEECFDVRPPISQVSLDEISALMESENVDEIKEGMNRLGHSVEKIFLADRLRQLTESGE